MKAHALVTHVPLAATIAPPTTKASRDFAKQLATATKPVVKKPMPSLEALVGATPTEAPTLAQIVAALVSTMGTAQAIVPDAPAPIATKPLAEAAKANVGATMAETPDQVKDAIVLQLVAVKPAPTPEAPLTPLEQAVHDMLAELTDQREPQKPDAPSNVLAFAPPTPIAPSESAIEIKPTAPTAPMAEQPQELVSQNHAHLVFDDPNGRIVMTVAIRGSEVNVTMRASDDATTAALARNAGTLDQAMRGRGLQLAQFDAQRDLTREQREKPMYERNTVKKSDAEPFTLEENQ